MSTPAPANKLARCLAHGGEIVMLHCNLYLDRCCASRPKLMPRVRYHKLQVLSSRSASSGVLVQQHTGTAAPNPASDPRPVSPARASPFGGGGAPNLVRTLQKLR